MSSRLWRTFRLVFLWVFLFVFVLTAIPVRSLEKASDLILVESCIVESSTGLPIENATVAFYQYVGTPSLLVSSGRTDSDGCVTTTVERGDYIVYAYYDDPSTPGFDYVPSRQTLHVVEDTSVQVSLVGGASVIVEGDIRIVNVNSPPYEFCFEVRNPQSETTLDFEGYIFLYGTTASSQNDFIDLDLRHVIVPTERGVSIKATLTFREPITETRPGRSWTTYERYSYFNHTFSIDEAGHFTLSQGVILRLDVRQYTLSQDLNQVTDMLRSLTENLDEMEEKGFYTVTERRDLSTIMGLEEDGRFELDQALYEESFTDLREAYVRALSLNSRLEGMYLNAKISAAILVFFLAFTATVVAHLLFEQKLKKITTTSVLYPVLVVVLYLVYPGCQLLSPTLFLGIVTAALGTTLCVTYVFPRFIKEKAQTERIAFRSAVIEFFSITKRNLKRRKLRTTLTLITVMVLVMAFVTLTSFSVNYGLVINPQHLVTAPSDGLMIRRPPPELNPADVQYNLRVRPTFRPLNISDIDWLERKPETSMVAPKAENYPSLSPIDVFIELPTRGCIGILPSVEARINRINETIVEGRYLQDDDGHTFLISAKAMKEQNLKIGDTLFFVIGETGIRAELVGAFDDDLLAQITDLDGKSILPYTLWLGPAEQDKPPAINIRSCLPSEVAIIPWQTALEFQDVYLSRLDVIPKQAEGTVILARQVALERNLIVWTAIGGQISLTYLGSIFEWKGLPILVPWAIVILNVVVAMLSALYERRREVAILSAVGLNPSHVTGLFLTEAGIIGVIGGGLGYLLGLGLYPIMSILSDTIEVRQKVSALWCFGALGIAMTAVLIGAVTALKSSTIITPSLMRKWRIKKEKRQLEGEPWNIEIPVQVFSKDIDSFMNHLQNSLKAHQKFTRMPNIELVSQIEEEKSPQAITKKITFVYPGDPPTSNDLVATRKKGAEMYSVNLISRGEMRGVQETARLIREIVIHWNVESVND